MAAPQGGYPPQEGYAQPGYGSPDPTQQQESPVPQQAPAAAGGKKKRAYAGQAFEFGAGANAALGGQPVAGGAYDAYPQQPQTMGYQQPTYGADPTQMQQPVAPAPDVAQMTSQFGGMGMAEPHHMPPPQQPAAQPQRNVQLNQLYPTDLISQPFNVAELDYPPPPIILPPGVRLPPSYLTLKILIIHRPVFTHPPRPIAPQNICGRP